MKHTITTAFFLSFIVFGFSESLAPHFDWVKQAGGGYTNYGKSLAVDANGNSYVTGIFEETVILKYLAVHGDMVSSLLN